MLVVLTISAGTSKMCRYVDKAGIEWPWKMAGLSLRKKSIICKKVALFIP